MAVNPDLTAATVRFQSALVAPFGSLRTASAVGLFDSAQLYNNLPELWQEQTAGSGSTSFSAAKAATTMSITGSGDSVVRQTRQYFKYQPGKGQRVLQTFALGPHVSGVTYQVGYFDDDNGVFFERAADGTLYFVVRSNVSGTPTDTKIAQTSWNLDLLDGTGYSGKTLDASKTQILYMDLEWLGVGEVRFGFVDGGNLVYAHAQDHANSSTTVYMSTATLPLRYRIAGGDGASAASMDAICAEVSSEGGAETERGYPATASNGVAEIPVTTRRPVLSIRPAASFNSVTNRSLLLPESVEVYSEDVAAYYEVVYGGTLTNASFAAVNTAYSAAEKDIAANGITGGRVIHSGYAIAGGIGSGARPGSTRVELTSLLPLALDIDGAHPTSPLSDTLSVVVTSMTGASTDVSAALNWRELR